MFELNGKTIRYEPLCGMEWLRRHYLDHTHAEIEALALEMSYNGRELPPVPATAKRGKVKSIVKELR
ncbi:hypothetical protein ES703_84737 [subsurface metagenome]